MTSGSVDNPLQLSTECIASVNGILFLFTLGGKLVVMRTEFSSYYNNVAMAHMCIAPGLETSVVTP